MILSIFWVSSSMLNEQRFGPGQLFGFAAMPNFWWYQQMGILIGWLAIFCSNRRAGVTSLGSAEFLMPIGRFVEECVLLDEDLCVVEPKCVVGVVSMRRSERLTNCMS